MYWYIQIVLHIKAKLETIEFLENSYTEYIAI